MNRQPAFQPVKAIADMSRGTTTAAESMDRLATREQWR